MPEFASQGGAAWSGGVSGPGGVVCQVRGGGWCAWSGGGGWCAWSGGGGVSGPGGGGVPQCLVGYHHPPCEQNDKQV